ncbi:hypothetical protein ACLOJK_021806 [Asimina triloba]
MAYPNAQWEADQGTLLLPRQKGGPTLSLKNHATTHADVKGARPALVHRPFWARSGNRLFLPEPLHYGSCEVTDMITCEVQLTINGHG